MARETEDNNNKGKENGGGGGLLLRGGGIRFGGAVSNAYSGEVGYEDANMEFDTEIPTAAEEQEEHDDEGQMQASHPSTLHRRMVRSPQKLSIVLDPQNYCCCWKAIKFIKPGSHSLVALLLIFHDRRCDCCACCVLLLLRRRVHFVLIIFQTQRLKLVFVFH